MVKLTALYNLPPGADHEAFLRWRTTEHQADNAAIPGVIKTDFYIIQGAWRQENPPYRYMTEAYFPDMETFEKTFYDPDYQAKMDEWLKMLDSNPVYLISTEGMSSQAE